MHSTGVMRWSLLFAFVVVGCAVAEPEPEVEITTAAQKCNDPLTCPGNTNIYVGTPFNEFDDLRVSFSTRGFKIINVTHNGLNVPVFTANGAQIHAVRSDNVVLDGLNAVGIVARILHTSGKQFDMTIEQAQYVPYYVGPGLAIVGYYITYREVGTHDNYDLCAYKEVVDSDGLMGTWAVFQKGDRFDPDTGVITASDLAVGSWVTVGCAGDATIKMLRDRNGYAVNPASTPAQRQATVLMISASYCGPGKAYTKLGTPLTWVDKVGHPMGAITSIEAVWDSTGATCIRKPRFVAPEAVTCVPQCDDQAIAHWTDHWIMSANPVPQP